MPKVFLRRLRGQPQQLQEPDRLQQLLLVPHGQQERHRRGAGAGEGEGGGGGGEAAGKQVHR